MKRFAVLAAAILAAISLIFTVSAPATAAKTEISLGVNFGPRDTDGNCLNVVLTAVTFTPVDTFEFVVSPAPLKGKARKDAEPAVVPAAAFNGVFQADYATGFLAQGAPIYIYIKAVLDGRVIAKTTGAATC